jgi:class 3 adenylate cyclase
MRLITDSGVMAAMIRSAPRRQNGKEYRGTLEAYFLAHPRLLEKNPNAQELEKRKADVSVLFLDVESYTRLSEQLPPQSASTASFGTTFRASWRLSGPIMGILMRRR